MNKWLSLEQILEQEASEVGKTWCELKRLVEIAEEWRCTKRDRN
jgi:hypothetical protein